MPWSPDEFCSGCGLVADQCACDVLPRVEVPVRFVVVQHASELFRQSNTGRIAAAMLPGSSLLVHGARSEHVRAGLETTAEFEPPASARVLFPMEGAREMEPGEGPGANGEWPTYVLLDATWSQARRMTRRVPGLMERPFVALPPGPSTSWPLRRAPKPGCVCTLEAAVRVVELHGFDAEAREMRKVMDEIGRRLFRVRGRRTNPVLAAAQRADDAESTEV